MFTMSAVDGYWPLLACITLTRGFGQGALTVTSITLAGRAFGRKASWPMAIYSVALTIGFIIVSIIVMEAMKAIDASTEPDAFRAWRGVWRMIGLSILVSLVPAAWLLPKGVGRGGDRFESPLLNVGSADHGPALDDSYTLREALATPIFWVFAAATTSFGLAYAGLSLFNENVLNVRGFGKVEFETMLGVMTALGLVGNGICGFGAKRWSYRTLTAIAMVVYAVALVSLALIETTWQLLIASGLLGIAGGMITVIFFAVWGRTFGQLHLGRIQGTTQMLSVFASAIGPVLFAISFERTGSYSSILFTLAAVVVLIAVAAIIVAAPRRSSAG
jgi:MFS family permease